VHLSNCIITVHYELVRYIVHLVEQTYRLIESQQQAVTSAMNIQSSRNTSTAAAVSAIQECQNELYLTVMEEKDGRINEG
jgi:hypothetical protein